MLPTYCSQGECTADWNMMTLCLLISLSLCAVLLSCAAHYPGSAAILVSHAGVDCGGDGGERPGQQAGLRGRHLAAGGGGAAPLQVLLLDCSDRFLYPCDPCQQRQSCVRRVPDPGLPGAAGQPELLPTPAPARWVAGRAGPLHCPAQTAAGSGSAARRGRVCCSAPPAPAPPSVRTRAATCRTGSGSTAGETFPLPTATPTSRPLPHPLPRPQVSVS